MHSIKPFFRRSLLRTISIGSAENKYQGILWAESSAVSVSGTDAVSLVKLWSSSVLKKKKQKTNTEQTKSQWQMWGSFSCCWN